MYSSQDELTVSIACESSVCFTNISSDATMVIDGRLSSSEMIAVAQSKFPGSASDLSFVFDSFFNLPPSKQTTAVLIRVPPSPSGMFNDNLAARAVLHGDFCGSSCDEHSVSLFYQGMSCR